MEHELLRFRANTRYHVPHKNKRVLTQRLCPGRDGAQGCQNSLTEFLRGSPTPSQEPGSPLAQDQRPEQAVPPGDSGDLVHTGGQPGTGGEVSVVTWAGPPRGATAWRLGVGGVSHDKAKA